MAYSQFISPSIGVLKDLIKALTVKSRSNNINKKMLVREIRDNLISLSYYKKPNLLVDQLIDQLRNDAYTEALQSDFDFRKLKKGNIKDHHIIDKRNLRYLDWTCDELMNKIDEKIEELRSIKSMFGSISNSGKNYRLMISNQFYRLKLLAEFIHDKK